VSVQLGNALMEQVERAFDSFHGEDENRLTAWIEPTTTGALQSVLQPVSLADFDAQMKGESLQTMAWIRAGGLRLAPIMVTWSQIDNPAGAQVFVDEVNKRKEKATEDKSMLDPFDYWVTWLLIGIVSFVLPIFWWKKWQQQRS
jgi:hypothetical protein